MYDGGNYLQGTYIFQTEIGEGGTYYYTAYLAQCDIK